MTSRLFLQTALIVAFIGGIIGSVGACGVRSAGSSGSSEAEFSSNFDEADVAPALVRVSRLLESGFDSTAAVAVADRIVDQPVGTTRAYRYEVRYAGANFTLRIEAFMDDVDAIDLYFFGNATLVAAIEQALSEDAEDSSTGVR